MQKSNEIGTSSDLIPQRVINLLALLTTWVPQLLSRVFEKDKIIFGQGASYQIRKIEGCACARNGGKVFLRLWFQRKPLVSDPGVNHGTCVTHVPWGMAGSLTCGDGENVHGISGSCAPPILRIWLEVHGGEIKRTIGTHGEQDVDPDYPKYYEYFLYYLNALWQGHLYLRRTMRQSVKYRKLGRRTLYHCPCHVVGALSLPEGSIAAMPLTALSHEMSHFRTGKAYSNFAETGCIHQGYHLYNTPNYSRDGHAFF